MKVLKSFYRMGVVFALTVMHPTFSAGAEITCVEFYSGQNDPARLAQLYPSGRKPGPDTCRTMLIKGAITSDDPTKFAQLVQKNHPFLDSVMLWSSGGSVEGAMKIGRLIRKGLIRTQAPFEVDDKNKGRGLGFASRPVPGCPLQRPTSLPKDCHCASACFLIWSGGVIRTGNSLGLHRPTPASAGFGNLPPDRASVLYGQILLDIQKYLTEMEVPRRFVEIMMDTTSSEIRWLKLQEAEVEEVPSIAEWVGVTCGKWTKSEFDTMNKIGFEMDQLKRTVSERDRMLREMLEKRYTEWERCRLQKILGARDAISNINAQ